MCNFQLWWFKYLHHYYSIGLKRNFIWASSDKSHSLLNTIVHVVQILPLSWRGPLSYRNQSIDLQRKSMDWFLYDNGNQWTGFYMITASVLKGLNVWQGSEYDCDYFYLLRNTWNWQKQLFGGVKSKKRVLRKSIMKFTGKHLYRNTFSSRNIQLY